MPIGPIQEWHAHPIPPNNDLHRLDGPAITSMWLDSMTLIWREHGDKKREVFMDIDGTPYMKDYDDA